MTAETATTTSPLHDLTSNASRFLFFTGKGGVGKTSLACATAVNLADKGRRVLLVSTDPASNLAHVFETPIPGQGHTAIDTVPGLDALNIDPEAAAAAYRERIVNPVRGVLPESSLREMEEQLSGACTTEIAAFDEFTQLLTDKVKTAGYDHVIFDTAPTGHTLRLLRLPSAWTGFLDTNTSGASCLGPLAGLEKQRQQYAAAVDTLANGALTTLVLVSRPQRASFEEAARTSGELAQLGIMNQRLVINGRMPEGHSGDPLAKAMATRDRYALDHMPADLGPLPTISIALQPRNLVGVDALRAMARADGPEDATVTVGSLPALDAPPLDELLTEIEADGRGLVMVMGKGGVGKTTIAAALASALAERGHEVHLTTTDPAAHITGALDGQHEHMMVSRIDPEEEVARYRAHVLKTKGRDLDDEGRAMLEEDLRSPCTEEIAVFQAFSRVIREAGRRFVVMDTAPTGHTLLLLDATGSYHRDIMRHAKGGTRLVTPMMRLQDPSYTKMLIVTLPETTPVLEAAALQDDLRRAGIEPWAWVVNASMAAAGPSDPLLMARAQAEHEQIAAVREHLAKRMALVPWLPKEPVGPVKLAELFQSFSTN